MLKQAHHIIVAMGKKSSSNKSAEKKAAKSEAAAAAKSKSDAIKVANAVADPLATLPKAFASFTRNGLTASIAHCRSSGDTTVRKQELEQLHSLLATPENHRELAEEDARLLIVRACVPEKGMSTPPSPAASPVKDAGGGADGTAEPEAEEPDAEAEDDNMTATSGSKLLGFLHFRHVQ